MNYPTIRVVFDRKKVATKDRKGLVQIEIMSGRRRKWISTQVRVFANEWNDRHMICGRLDADVLNSSILSQMNNIQRWVNELRFRGEPFDFSKLDTFLKNQEITNDFIEYIESRIEERSDIRANTKKSHRQLLTSLRAFKQIRHFSDLNKQNIYAYDEWLHKRGYLQTTIHSYHKILKTYINDAISRDIIADSPYKSFKVDRGKSAKRMYLTEKELGTVMSARMLTESLENIRDLFLFQCFTGMAYADLANFDWSKVEERNGKYVISDIRRKSGENFYLVLLSPAVYILKKHDFKLPLISNQKYNLNLKVLANIAGIDRGITSHMARHTFAVYSLNNGVSIETLAKMMGHTDIKTTQLYAEIVNPTVEAAFGELENKVQKLPAIKKNGSSGIDRKGNKAISQSRKHQ